MSQHTADTKDRRWDSVDVIEIRIGSEVVRHEFGRRVMVCEARKYAQHYLDVMTGEPSEFVANLKENVS